MKKPSAFEIYQSRSGMLNPLTLVLSVWKGLNAGRSYAWAQFLGQLQTMQKKFFLGILWEILTPLVMAGLFIFLKAKSILVLGPKDVSYMQFALIGIFYWQIFSRSLNASIEQTRSSLGLSSFVKIAPEALWLKSLFYSLFVAVVNLTVLFSILIFLGAVQWGQVTAASGVALLLLILGINCGFLILPFGFIYQDIFRIVQLALPLLFVLTPVVYDVGKFEKFSSIIMINPVAILIEAARSFLIGTSLDFFALGIVSCAILISLIPTLVYFRLAKPYIVERATW